MSKTHEVNWYEEDVVVQIDAAGDEILTELALFAEGAAKVGASVDTGFMRNAIYAITPLVDHRGNTWPSGEYTSKATGVKSYRALAPALRLKEGEAALHAAAEYTLYQEMKLGFLYKAAEAAAREFQGIVSRVGRRFQ